VPLVRRHDLEDDVGREHDVVHYFAGRVQTGAADVDVREQRAAGLVTARAALPPAAVAAAEAAGRALTPDHAIDEALTELADGRGAQDRSIGP